MAINISTDLELFRFIRPCGLDVRMTSLKELQGVAPSMATVQERFSGHFLKVFKWSS
jgi:lipoate-protein ligase B